MDIILKVTNSRKKGEQYNHIVIDKQGNKYFIKAENELIKDNYYIVNDIEFIKEFSIEGLFIRIKSYTNINKLDIVNNKLCLNSQPVKSNIIVLNANELKLLEKYARIKEVSRCLNGIDSAAQGNKYNRELQRLDWDIKRLRSVI